MAQNTSTAVKDEPKTTEMPKPDPALKRLDKLVGTWKLTGRTLDSDTDNITGHITIEWMPGGFFMIQRGDWDFTGMKMQTMEIIHYDPKTKHFGAYAYSNMDSKPLYYEWDVQGDKVTHWTEGSKYTGLYSNNGNTLSGGWRPDKGIEANGGNSYDAVMTRVK